MAGHAPPEYERLSFETYQPVLDQVCAIVPAGQVMTLLADRGFLHEQLLDYLQKLGWHFRLRLKGSTLVHLPDQPVSAVKDLCPPAGESRFFQQVSILGTAVGPVSLALACLLEQPDDPWFVASDEQTSARTLDEYGLRFGIEETFRDEKSGGYQLQTSRLATPDALERLVLILALSTGGHKFVAPPAGKTHELCNELVEELISYLGGGSRVAPDTPLTGDGRNRGMEGEKSRR